MTIRSGFDCWSKARATARTTATLKPRITSRPQGSRPTRRGSYSRITIFRRPRRIYSRFIIDNPACPPPCIRSSRGPISVTDALSIFQLLKRAREDGRNLIALAMGEPGVITRILGPAAGSYLTYGSLARGAESAPGQLTCRELQSIYRVHQLSHETAITGIIGRPVSQSASPAMHNAAFQACGLDFVYLPIEVDDLEQFFARFVREESRAY